METRRKWLRRETGQVLVIFALALPVLLGMSALVVDVGNLFVQKRSLQKAADASALAATQRLDGSTCQTGTPCNDDVKQLASNFNQGNDPLGSGTLPQCDTNLGITENCYELFDNAEFICAPDAPVPSSCIPVRVQVRVSRRVSLFFGFLIGKSNINVHAVARAFVNVTITPGTTTVIDGITTTIPGTVTVIGGTTTTVGGTQTVIGGTTVTLPATTVTTPATTTVTGGSTITNPDAIVTTTTAGKPALLFAKSTACNIPLKIGGANSIFLGAVISNGGVQVNSSNIKGDEMVWGHGTDPSCVQTKPAEWKGIIREAPRIYDWLVPIPVCVPATACKPGSNVLAEFVIDDLGNQSPCTPWANFSTSNPKTGLYCSTTTINLPNNKSLTAAGGFGFVAPSVNLANGQEYRGYSALYSAYGGLFAYAYNGNVSSSGSGTGFRGAIFAERGDVSLAGSSSSAVCSSPGGGGTPPGGCGFIEALTISLTGANAVWQGLGPGFGGTTTTTTTPGTTVTTSGSTVTIPATTVTTPTTTTTTPGTTTTVGGTVTVVGGSTTTTPGTLIVNPGTTVTTPGTTTVGGDLNLDK